MLRNLCLDNALGSDVGKGFVLSLVEGGLKSIGPGFARCDGAWFSARRERIWFAAGNRSLESRDVMMFQAFGWSASSIRLALSVHGVLAEIEQSTECAAHKDIFSVRPLFWGVGHLLSFGHPPLHKTGPLAVGQHSLLRTY